MWYYTTRLWLWPIRVMKLHIKGLGAIKRAMKQNTEETLVPDFPHRGFTGIWYLQDIYNRYATTTSFWKGLENFDNDHLQINIRGNSAQKETKVHPSMPCPNSRLTPLSAPKLSTPFPRITLIPAPK